MSLVVYLNCSPECSALLRKRVKERKREGEIKRERERKRLYVPSSELRFSRLSTFPSFARILYAPTSKHDWCEKIYSAVVCVCVCVRECLCVSL